MKKQTQNFKITENKKFIFFPKSLFKGQFFVNVFFKVFLKSSLYIHILKAFIIIILKQF